MIEEDEIKTTAAKLYILMSVAEIYFLVIRDEISQNIRFRCENAIKSIGMFTRLFDKHIQKHKRKEAEAEAESNVETVYKIIEAFCETERQGIAYKFANDFYRICKQNNIKV